MWPANIFSFAMAHMSKMLLTIGLGTYQDFKSKTWTLLALDTHTSFFLVSQLVIYTSVLGLLFLVPFFTLHMAQNVHPMIFKNGPNVAYTMTLWDPPTLPVWVLWGAFPWLKKKKKKQKQKKNKQTNKQTASQPEHEAENLLLSSASAWHTYLYYDIYINDDTHLLACENM